MLDACNDPYLMVRTRVPVWQDSPLGVASVASRSRRGERNAGAAASRDILKIITKHRLKTNQLIDHLIIIKLPERFPKSDGHPKSIPFNEYTDSKRTSNNTAWKQQQFCSPETLCAPNVMCCGEGRMGVCLCVGGGEANTPPLRSIYIERKRILFFDLLRCPF